MDPVKVYGAEWCHDTQETRSHLSELGVDYQFIDIDRDEQAAQWVRNQNDGEQKLPTVNVAGFVMSVPSDAELDTALRAKGLLET